MKQIKNALALHQGDSSFTPRELDKHLSNGQPVIIRGLNKGARAIGCWTPEYFFDMIKKNGDVISPRRLTPVGSQKINFKDITLAPQPISEIVADCIDPEDPDKEIYVPGIRMRNLQYMEQDAPRTSLLRDIAGVYGEVFMGRNTQCVAHFHRDSQALLCQMQGRKHVRLYPPSQLNKLSPFSAFTKYFNRSKINYFQHNRQDFPNTRGIDPHRYPDAVRAQCIDVVVEPGDALFIPIHWTHVTQGKDWNVSMVYFWRARLRDWKVNGPAIRTLMSYPIKTLRFPFSIPARLYTLFRLALLSKQSRTAKMPK
ncbi:cupin-like domain-containing protein [Thalassomonas viridans]|uniref:Cupin-like domain-containing protein n=1 Tax=Thalassomonas viridans TaxID=137584 RepID=A0AAE9Z9L2_9GAMM|nr:cupin-like domain-containing protein [Thalassomonas viridans]WDE09246.1 cupin-like domain-containing protein [Thalassomonas viridans]